MLTGLQRGFRATPRGSFRVENRIRARRVVGVTATGGNTLPTLCISSNNQNWSNYADFATAGASSNPGGLGRLSGGGNGWQLGFFGGNATFFADLGAGSLCLVSTSSFGIQSGTTYGAVPDVIWSREGAGIWQAGLDSATPVNQVIKACDGVGTNIAGASLTHRGGQSTGTGRGGDYLIQTADSGSSGSSANGYRTRNYYSARFVDLTESAATTIASITLAAGTVVGLEVSATTDANDGTDFQALTSRLIISAVNKGGTITATISQVNGTTAASAGTLTSTYTVVASGNNIQIQCNAVSSLTQTILRCRWAIVAMHSNDPATVTPS